MATGDDFPPTDAAWPLGTAAPGLLAAGGDLSVQSLLRAYARGIFPWFSEGDPILWWSTDPRMVLETEAFRLHRSLQKTLRNFARTPGCAIRVDCAFADVIAACAAPRSGTTGTWIVPPMVKAYTALHQAGYAHSVETWIDDRLVGGLYFVAIGRAVFGESMFARETDASKTALAALICMCREHGIRLIDCQQNTAHLATLGARTIPRTEFAQHLHVATRQAPCQWQFSPGLWTHMLARKAC
jgi:leucyl/phenylalanyl-tRNA--protein transferase